MEKKCARTAPLEATGCIFLMARMPEWNLGLIPRTWRNMVFISDIHVLSAAFLMGLAAAAPMGPVNMLAIRRGLIGGWRHTLACGVGSVTGELILFSLVHHADRGRSLPPPRHWPDLLPPGQRRPWPDPPRLRHILRNNSVPPFLRLKLLFHDPGREPFSQADEFIGWIRL